MQRAARTVQPSLSALGSVSGCPRGLGALLPAPLRRSLCPSAPPPASASACSAPSPYLVAPAAGGGSRGARDAAITGAAEMAPAAVSDGPLEHELQQACAAVRLASALCQVRTPASVQLAIM